MMFYSFACGCNVEVFPTLFLKRLSFPHCIFLDPLLKLIDHICMSLFLDSILFHWPLCLFSFCVCASTIPFWLLKPCNIVWNQGTWDFQLCFFSVLFDYLWFFLCFHTNFRIICFSSLKCAVEILIGIILNL